MSEFLQNTDLDRLLLFVFFSGWLIVAGGLVIVYRFSKILVPELKDYLEKFASAIQHIEDLQGAITGMQVNLAATNDLSRELVTLIKSRVEVTDALLKHVIKNKSSEI